VGRIKIVGRTALLKRRLTKSGLRLVVAAGLAALFLPCQAWAEWRPTKPVEFVIMAGKGGGADKAVRRMAKIIADKNLAPVAFEPLNVTGESGANALVYLEKRHGDDHLLLFTLNSFYTTPLRRKDLGIDIADYAPIGRMAEDTFVLWVHKGHKDIKTLGDFITAARLKGKGWLMAGTGTGSEDNLLTDFLNASYGLDITYKPFKGGGRVARELAEQRCDSTVNNPAEQSKYYPAGDTQPLTAFTHRRLEMYPRIPALRETGMDFQYYMQRSVVGAPGMSREAKLYYQRLFKTVFDTPEWQSYRRKNSLRGDYISGPELMDYWVTQRRKHERWLMALQVMLKH